MLIVGTSAHFDAAHYIPGHPTCGEVHGHRWQVEVEYKTLEPFNLDDMGMLVDFGEVKTPIRMLDHPGCVLNEIEDLECPSAELIASWLHARMPPAPCVCLVTVTVWESPDSYAIWSDVIAPRMSDEAEDMVSRMQTEARQQTEREEEIPF